MLKRILINQKTIPVPVPIKNLHDAWEWIERNMIPAGQTVTAASLDGKPVLEYWGQQRICSAILLSVDSRFEIRIESPMDLALQSLESVHNLSGALLRNLKPLAVHLWQARAGDVQSELAGVIDDVALIVDLISHAKGMCADAQMDFAPISDIQTHLHKIHLSLIASSSASDWKASAQILLRDTATSVGLETTLRSLQDEVESCHLRLLTSQAAKVHGA